ncbi:MAG: hypothetical protein RMY16_02855 [Nostoc sp. DedQUE12b]|uniref:hypothetical protein n=1 Tax=Nostoc sp. DedQUE12b TaxID=3075398 RepID=UPI002AD30D93|nr:hypothetical protein [Nostoc sp. DedQUE12b]MDZ8084524.1 hypothetical protein [Nostoc sp. DedQUE12b]
METITINNSVFLIPTIQPKLQANCAKKYEQFFLDCPPKLTILEAQAGGYLMQGQNQTTIPQGKKR